MFVHLLDGTCLDMQHIQHTNRNVVINELSRHLHADPYQIKLSEPVTHESTDEESHETTHLFAIVEPAQIVLSQGMILGMTEAKMHSLQTCVNEDIIDLFLPLLTTQEWLLCNPHPKVVDAILPRLPELFEKFASYLCYNPDDRIVDYCLAKVFENYSTEEDIDPKVLIAFSTNPNRRSVDATIHYLEKNADYLFFHTANASYVGELQDIVINLFRQDDERAILTAWRMAEHLGFTDMLPHNPHPVAVELWKKYLFGKVKTEFDQELPVCLYDSTDLDIVSYILSNDLYHARLHTNPSDVVVDWLITHHSARLSQSACQNKNERMIDFLISTKGQRKRKIDVSCSSYPQAVEYTKKRIEAGWRTWTWWGMCPEVTVWLYNRLYRNGTLEDDIHMHSSAIFETLGRCKYLSVRK